MDDVRAKTEALLAEKPHVESKLERVLSIDASGHWEFEDIPLDSGEFGELVSRGVATQHEEGYRLADREAVAAALEMDGSTSPESDGTIRRGEFEVDRHRLLGIAVLMASLGLVAVLRLLPLDGVFRSEYVMLAGNDPWGYRYWVETLLRADISPLSIGALPAEIGQGLSADILYTLVGWWLAELLGGSLDAAGVALALYPVVASVLSAFALFLLAVRLTGDRRVGQTAVVFFAVTPVLAYRTMVGFADHDALDFLWLSLTLYGIVLVVTADHGIEEKLQSRRVVGIVLAGIAVGAQTLSWRGGPLLLVPLAIYVFAVTISGLRGQPSPRDLLGPLLAALAIASVLTLGAGLAFDWLTFYRVGTPALLLIGTAGTWGFVRVVRRRQLPLGQAVVGLLVGGIVGGVFLLFAIPPLATGLTEFVGYMKYFTWSGISETAPLIGSGVALFRPIFLLGLPFVLGIAGLLAITLRTYRNHRPGWLLLAVYGWYFLLLAIVQNRFAGPLGLVWSIIAAVGFVHGLAVLEIVRPVASGWSQLAAESSYQRLTVPDLKTVSYLCVFLLIVSSVGLAQIPLKQNGLVISDTTYDVAKAIEADAEARHLEYPRNYVFSQWDKNRVYNYVVSGESRSYIYARDHYATFLSSPESGRWYGRLRDRAGYIVTRDRDGPPARSMQMRLHRHFGSATSGSKAVSHYRAMYSTGRGSRLVFALVDGATVAGDGPPNSSVVASTTVSIPPDERRVSYEQRVKIDQDGEFRFVTPYPGTYAMGNESFVVTNAAVNTGGRVNVSLGDDRS